MFRIIIVLPLNPYATGVLSPSVHARLVEGITTYAADANITPDRIWTSLYSTDASEDEIAYIKAFRKQTLQGNSGLVFVGADPQRDILDAMANLAGALVRNFVRARIISVEEVLDYMENHGFPEHTCLLIPDFHIHTGSNQKTTRHRISKLVSLLLDRQARGLQTVLYVSSMHDLKLEYGRMIGRHIETHYHFVDVD